MIIYDNRRKTVTMKVVIFYSQSFSDGQEYSYYKRMFLSMLASNQDVLFNSGVYLIEYTEKINIQEILLNICNFRDIDEPLVIISALWGLNNSIDIEDTIDTFANGMLIEFAKTDNENKMDFNRCDCVFNCKCKIDESFPLITHKVFTYITDKEEQNDPNEIKQLEYEDGDDYPWELVIMENIIEMFEIFGWLLRHNSNFSPEQKLDENAKIEFIDFIIVQDMKTDTIIDNLINMMAITMNLFASRLNTPNSITTVTTLVSFNNNRFELLDEEASEYIYNSNNEVYFYANVDINNPQKFINDIVKRYYPKNKQDQNNIKIKHVNFGPDGRLIHNNLN